MSTLFVELESYAIGQSKPLAAVLDAIPWNSDGLIAVIAQQHDTREVLMLAWMNLAALQETLCTRCVCYWSRSRQCLWRKGEISGHVQALIEARLDCDGDALLLLVNQLGPACHTGRATCFYNAIVGDDVQVMTAPQPLGNT